jgi:transposase
MMVYIPIMPSLQRFSSKGHSYWRIVESYRRADGKPTVRVLMHLGKADDLLARLQQQEQGLRVRSVASGAVDALYRLAVELDVPNMINAAIKDKGGKAQVRDGLSVGDSLLLASLTRLCHPSSKRAIAEWAETTSVPARFGVAASALTSQHFWDQMDATPVSAVALAEERIVQRVLQSERLSSAGLLAYDTTNFFTYIDSTNERTKLAQRGHNKNGRHDLRQLGLALVVSQQGQIPLAHTLYDGSRPDVTTFREILAPLKRRLEKLVANASQMTLVFDQGAESTANLAQVRQGEGHYVTSLKPSHHRKWLAEVSDRLSPVTLSSGEQVRALKVRRSVHDVEQTVVVLWSEKLYEGQCRGLKTDLSRALRRLASISRHPRGGLKGAQDRVKQICNRQYLRQVLHCEVTQRGRDVVITPHVDQAQIEHLQKKYFGLRVLATSHEEWNEAQVIEAYRGQARVEKAFRDLKDPWVGAFRPQFHWTDQKLVVHAFCAVLALTLGRILLLRAEKAGFRGSLRSLIHKLASVRTCTLVQQGKSAGRPRVREQIEDCEPEIADLARTLGALAES